MCRCFFLCFFFQAEDGIRDLVRSRGLGDVYKRQVLNLSSDSGVIRVSGRVATNEQLRLVTSTIEEALPPQIRELDLRSEQDAVLPPSAGSQKQLNRVCLLYTSDAADERSSVDLGGRRIIKKKKNTKKKKKNNKEIYKKR